MTPFQRGSILGSVLGIVLCGGIGGVTAWAIVQALGLEGVLAAIAAAFMGMAVATAAWVACTVLVRALRRPR